MKDHRARSMGDTASAVGSMLLFVLFAVCMLMAVAVAADTYSRIKTGYQQSFGTAASIKYISNKLRAAETVTAEKYLISFMILAVSLDFYFHSV